MSTLEEANAAIATLQTIAQKLETAKLLLYNQHTYFCQTVEFANTHEEQMVLIGAYLATKNLLEDIEKQSNV